MNVVRIKGLTPTNTYAWVRVAAGGGFLVVPADATESDPGALAASRVVSVVATHPLAFIGFLDAAAAVNHWLHVFNLAAVPANGTAPSRVPIPLAPGQAFGTETPSVPYATGLVWAISTTQNTLTIGGAVAWVTSYHRP